MTQKQDSEQLRCCVINAPRILDSSAIHSTRLNQRLSALDHRVQTSTEKETEVKTRITGKFNGSPLDITIDSPLDGKETAVFAADFYNQLMLEAPKVLANAEKNTPIIAKAMRKLNEVFKAVAKTFNK